MIESRGHTRGIAASFMALEHKSVSVELGALGGTAAEYQAAEARCQEASRPQAFAHAQPVGVASAAAAVAAAAAAGALLPQATLVDSGTESDLTGSSDEEILGALAALQGRAWNGDAQDCRAIVDTLTASRMDRAVGAPHLTELESVAAGPRERDGAAAAAAVAAPQSSTEGLSVAAP